LHIVLLTSGDLLPVVEELLLLELLTSWTLTLLLLLLLWLLQHIPIEVDLYALVLESVKQDLHVRHDAL
jgi:hypothetical protein